MIIHHWVMIPIFVGVCLKRVWWVVWLWTRTRLFKIDDVVHVLVECEKRRWPRGTTPGSTETADCTMHDLPSGKLTWHGKSPFSMGKSKHKWPCSIAMLVYQRVVFITFLGTNKKDLTHGRRSPCPVKAQKVGWGPSKKHQKPPQPLTELSPTINDFLWKQDIFVWNYLDM